jgi:hypothetical protein
MTVAEMNKLLGKDFVKTFQVEMDLILAPLRKHLALGRPLSLGKELWEYVVADSIKDAEWCGAGKNIIDVRVNDCGFDVKAVSKQAKSTSSTEASMLQSFKDETKARFKSKDTAGIWDKFVGGWLSKVSSVKEYYLIGIIREKETLNCSICCFKVVKSALAFDPLLCEYTKSNTSMKINGLGNPDFIETRVYSSKTRLEIKFKSKVWNDATYALPIYKF